MADAAAVPLWFAAREARKHVKVVLSGEGADELFGGYGVYYQPGPWCRAAKACPAGGADDRPGRRRAAGRHQGQGPAQPDLDAAAAAVHGNAYVYRGDAGAALVRYGNGSEFDVTDPVYRQAAEAGLTTSPPCSWWTSIPGCPATSWSRPTGWRWPTAWSCAPRSWTARCSRSPRGCRWRKITRTTTKYALRRALEPIVPAHGSTGRNWASRCHRHWLRAGPLLEWAHEMVNASATDYLVDASAVRRMLDEHRSGAADHSRRLWTVLIFMLWHAIFVEHSIVPQISEPQYPVEL